MNQQKKELPKVTPPFFPPKSKEEAEAREKWIEADRKRKAERAERRYQTLDAILDGKLPPDHKERQKEHRVTTYLWEATRYVRSKELWPYLPMETKFDVRFHHRHVRTVGICAHTEPDFRKVKVGGRYLFMIKGQDDWTKVMELVDKNRKHLFFATINPRKRLRVHIRREMIAAIGTPISVEVNPWRDAKKLSGWLRALLRMETAKELERVA